MSASAVLSLSTSHGRRSSALSRALSERNGRRSSEKEPKKQQHVQQQQLVLQQQQKQQQQHLLQEQQQQEQRGRMELNEHQRSRDDSAQNEQAMLTDKVRTLSTTVRSFMTSCCATLLGHLSLGLSSQAGRFKWVRASSRAWYFTQVRARHAPPRL